MAAAKRATIGTTAAAIAETTATMKKKMVSSIAPAAMGRRGGEYVSTRASPSTLAPLTRLTLPYLWVRAGIIAIPARVYYLGMLMRGPSDQRPQPR